MRLTVRTMALSGILAACGWVGLGADNTAKAQVGVSFGNYGYGRGVSVNVGTPYVSGYPYVYGAPVIAPAPIIAPAPVVVAPGYGGWYGGGYTAYRPYYGYGRGYGYGYRPYGYGYGRGGRRW